MIDKASSRKTIMTLICLALAVFARLIPAPAGMTAAGIQVAGIFVSILMLWLFVDVDWTSLFAILALAFVPELTLNSVLKSFFGNSTFGFLLCTFMMTYAITQTPFIKRCAVAFISSRHAQKGPWHFLILYCAAAMLLGAFMSPNVLAVIFLSITEEMFELLGLKKGSKVASMFTIGMVCCINIASGMTPIAHVFPVISMNVYESLTGVSINYGRYMMVGIPVALLAFVLLMLIFRFIVKPDMTEIQNIDVSFMKNDMGPMDRREKAAVLIFGITIVLWVAPSLISESLPKVAAFINHFGTAGPPLLGITLLSIVRFDNKPLFDFKAATTKGTPWGTLAMTGAALAIGDAMSNADVGLTDWVSMQMGNFFSTGVAPMVMVLVLATWVVVQTNMCSNIVTSTVASTIATPLLLATGGAVNPTAMIVVIGMLSSYAFALPAAMPDVVLIIGSGWVDTGRVFRVGGLLCLLSILLGAFVGYPLGTLLF